MLIEPVYVYVCICLEECIQTFHAETVQKLSSGIWLPNAVSNPEILRESFAF